MRGSAAFRTAIAPGGALAGPWVRDPLWTRARAVPSLDLRFADNKSLVDATTGASLVTFTRASSATYVGSDGLVKSATTNEARFDHNPTTGESLGLLVEEARTNLLLNSATLSTQSVTVAAAANTLSFYGTGTVTLTGVSTAGPLVGTGANNRVSLTFTPTVGVLVVTVSGSVTNAQLEAGASPTSYIPTTTATVTRAADVASITGSNFSSWYNQTEGTVFSDSNIIASQVQTQTVWQLGGGTILSSLRQPQGTSNQFRALIGGTFTASPGTGGLLSAGTSRAGVAYLGTAGRLQVASSGVDSTGSSLDANKLDIGSLNPGSSLNGTIKRITYWPVRLANTTLQSITAP